MLTGIDTSHYSNLNVRPLTNAVKANKLYFNFIKASEGATIQDEKFMDIWKMSRGAGLLCSAFHFLRPMSDTAAQVTNFISQYKKVSRAGVLPPVVDIEWANVKTNGITTDQWKQLSPAQRIPKIKAFLTSIEVELKVKPAIYTHPVFWKELITTQSTSADNEFFSEFVLWIVDLKRSGIVPPPWSGTKAPFIQTHFGESATTTDLFDVSDQNVFTEDLKTLLNITVPGFTIMKGFPFSNIIIDLQQKLIEKGFLNDVADGAFGNNTELAVKAFQKTNALFENGIVDAQTWNKLL